MWEKVNTVLEDGLELPKTTFKLELAQSNIFQIYATTTHIVVLIRFPVVITSTNLLFWEPRTVPIVRENKAYQLVIDHEILLINQYKREWGTLRLLDYLLCRADNNLLCNNSLLD